MKTIRVMLVDDERAIRNILKMSVPWADYHMEVIGEAGSGSEAINNIDEFKPDLLVVDIKMPYMDGIEFSKILTRRYPGMRIIILTAYADFSYAKECIGIKNVLGYLLKPVDVKEIEKYLMEFLSTFEEIETENAELEKEKNTAGIIGEIDEFINQNYFNSYLNVGALAEHFSYSANYLGTLYKKQTGRLLSEKILEVRMEKAKQLKKEGMKMYMVSKEVGIADPVYFSKCFRKYTGINFSDYQEDKI